MNQIEREYKNALDEVCFSQEAKERMMKNLMNQQEQAPVKGRGFRSLRTVLIAAAVCLALVGTAFAASPGLRDLLAEALGGFAPYAQEQDGGTQTWNGLEFKVLSGLADENMLRVYVQVRDLEGRGRLDIHGDTWLQECPMFSVAGVKSSVKTTGGRASTTYNHYDETTQTAVVVCTRWGAGMEDLTGAELRADTVRNMMDDSRNAAVKIPLDVELLPSITLFKFQDMVLDGVRVEELRVSPLSITAISRQEGDCTKTNLDVTFRVQLKDGTQVETENGGASGHGDYWDSSGGNEHIVALIWNFADPVEVDEVVGVYIGEEYFPIK